MKSFNELGISTEVIRGIEELGFIYPTQIQEEIIPLVFESSNDVVGQAQTGTGKTAAFGVPIIDLIDININIVQALILAPTRELCIQISADLHKFSKYKKNLQIASVYGGVSITPQINQFRKKVHIVVATPGRMLDLLNRKAINTSGIKTVVLDEADEMLNLGFRDDLDAILSTVSSNRRTLLFSATMPAEVARIANSYMNDPVKITVGKQNTTPEKVRHVYYLAHARDRYSVLKRVADINPDIYGIIFCRTRAETKEVADKLMKDSYNADALHGDLSQAQRDQVMKRFREKSLQLLVATDVAARGIDVNDISHIINYNLPDDLEVYTHRSGRTGRAGKSGVSISIVNHHEKSKIARIEKNIGQKCEKLLIPTGPDICEKQLFRLIDRMENIQVNEDQISPFMDVVNKKLDWMSKEQLIKHFLSLEFNRFLDYYKNSPDLNYSSDNRQKERAKSGNNNAKFKGARKKDFARFFINIGKKDGANPRYIIGLINDCVKDRDIDIGTIDILNSFSFFETGKNYSSKILESLNNKSYKGKVIKVELAEKKESRPVKKEKRKRK